MIVDLPRFVAAERPYWDELRGAARPHGHRARAPPDAGRDPAPALSLRALLGRTWRASIPSPPTRRCAAFWNRWCRAPTPKSTRRATPQEIRWKRHPGRFPRAFRRHLGAVPAVARRITLLGCAFGWFAIRMDPHAKAVLMPFPGLDGSPAGARPQGREAVSKTASAAVKATFSAQLMTHNIQVTVLTFGHGA